MQTNARFVIFLIGLLKTYPTLVNNAIAIDPESPRTDESQIRFQ